MNRLALLSLAVFFVLIPNTFSQTAPSTIAYTVSMPEPSNHLFHVVLRLDGIKGEILDLKMPAWHPGYYRLIDYEKNVLNFRAGLSPDSSPMPWQKVTKNTWRVVTGNADHVFISYDVLGTVTFSAQNFLNENRAFIAPTGMYMYLPGQLQHPVSVSIQLPQNWTRIATGLDMRPIANGNGARVFTAPDFDTLYDCPMLIGNQETLDFQVQGRLHTVAIENIPASVDRPRMIADLKQMVETAAKVIGDIGYVHYAFLMMGSGNGGIEHSNSSANSFNGSSLTTPAGYLSWLSFISHEYFHNYNVKRIRPIALGPFDYDSENLTNMLWVSEGLSVYYQDLVLVRAGIQTKDQYLEKMTASINSFENAPGHHYQSATDSSMTTWGTSGVGNDRNTTISYYNNGSMLGAMLDLKIRNDSGNRKSLDDVMRTLYNKYYQEKKRGFTDEEFRLECEAAAGGPLTEVFEYASTTKDVDYAKYFALAGLGVTFTTEDAPGSYLGLNMQTRDGKLIVSGVTPASPAQRAGLGERDQILEVDGIAATPKAINDMLSARKPGDKTRLKISRNNTPQEVEVTLDKNVKRTFRIQPGANPSALQGAILKDWLRAAQ
jgi:Predicted protease with the C-terminal PDZ domain